MAALGRAWSHGGGTELDEPSRMWPWVRLVLALWLFHFVVGGYRIAGEICHRSGS